MEDSLIWVGRVVKTQGVKGQVRVSSPAGEITTFSRGKVVYLRNRQGVEKPLTVHSSRPYRQGIIVCFEEIRRVEEAAALVGWSIHVPKGSLQPLPPNEFYEYQLLGLEVKTENGIFLGILEEIMPTGSNDVFVVRKNGQEVLIPATDEVVVQVNLQDKVMVIHPLEGLLSENDL